MAVVTHRDEALRRVLATTPKCLHRRHAGAEDDRRSSTGGLNPEASRSQLEPPFFTVLDASDPTAPGFPVPALGVGDRAITDPLPPSRQQRSPRPTGQAPPRRSQVPSRSTPRRLRRVGPDVGRRNGEHPRCGEGGRRRHGWELGPAGRCRHSAHSPAGGVGRTMTRRSSRFSKGTTAKLSSQPLPTDV